MAFEGWTFVKREAADKKINPATGMPYGPDHKKFNRDVKAVNQDLKDLRLKIIYLRDLIPEEFERGAYVLGNQRKALHWSAEQMLKVIKALEKMAR